MPRLNRRAGLALKGIIQSYCSRKKVGERREFAMSALPPKADICTALAHVRFGPKADMPHLTKERCDYCALFLVSRAFCWSSFSSAAFSGTSLTVSLSILPENRNGGLRSEEHTSELQSLRHLVCRLLLEK